MIEIIPAIMPANYDDLCEKASRVTGIAPLAQIDVMDGKFVKSKSWPYREAGNANDAHFLAMQTQEEMLPYFDELDYELDLMINEPEKHIDEWLPLGASRLIFHLESIEDSELCWSNDIWKEGARDIGGQKVIEVGLAVHPGASFDELLPHLPRIDFVQCMGIDRVGFQGEQFDERALALINRIRASAPNLPISVDGGVNSETAALMKAAGATRLVSGSKVFNASDMAEAIDELASA